MKKAIIAKKIGMTQVFSPEGAVVPVTVLEAGPCSVVQVKTEETDGYNAVQLSFGAVKDKKVSKPLKGHYEKANVIPRKRLKEFRVDNLDQYALGSEINCSVFEQGDKVDISGKSKGKGFQGNIKRHGQHRGPMKHGSKYHRAVGSMGGSSSPSRVFKGKKLPGHMGDKKCTVQNLTIIKSDAEKNLLLVKGAVPGSNGSVVYVVDSVKN